MIKNILKQTKITKYFKKKKKSIKNLEILFNNINI